MEHSLAKNLIFSDFKFTGDNESKLTFFLGISTGSEGSCDCYCEVISGLVCSIEQFTIITVF